MNSLSTGTQRFIAELCIFLQDHPNFLGLISDKNNKTSNYDGYILYTLLTSNKPSPLIAFFEKIWAFTSMCLSAKKSNRGSQPETISTESYHFYNALATKLGTFIVYNGNSFWIAQV